MSTELEGPALPGTWAHTLQTERTLARIEGLLEGVLKGYETRFASLEAGYAVHEQRLNDKGKVQARHDERISDLEERQAAVEGDRGPRAARGIAILALLIGLPGALLALTNYAHLNGLVGP